MDTLVNACIVSIGIEHKNMWKAKSIVSFGRKKAPIEGWRNGEVKKFRSKK